MSGWVLKMGDIDADLPILGSFNEPVDAIVNNGSSSMKGKKVFMWREEEKIEKDEGEDAAAAQPKGAEFYKNKKKRRGNRLRPRTKLHIEEADGSVPAAKRGEKLLLKPSSALQFEGIEATQRVQGDSEKDAHTSTYVILQPIKKMKDGKEVTDHIRVIPLGNWYNFKKPNVVKEQTSLEQIDKDFERAAEIKDREMQRIRRMRKGHLDENESVTAGADNWRRGPARAKNAGDKFDDDRAESIFGGSSKPRNSLKGVNVAMRKFMNSITSERDTDMEKTTIDLNAVRDHDCENEYDAYGDMSDDEEEGDSEQDILDTKEEDERNKLDSAEVDGDDADNDNSSDESDEDDVSDDDAGGEGKNEENRAKKLAQSLLSGGTAPASLAGDSGAASGAQRKTKRTSYAHSDGSSKDSGSDAGVLSDSDSSTRNHASRVSSSSSGTGGESKRVKVEASTSGAFVANAFSPTSSSTLEASSTLELSLTEEGVRAFFVRLSASGPGKITTKELTKAFKKQLKAYGDNGRIIITDICKKLLAQGVLVHEDDPMQGKLLSLKK